MTPVLVFILNLVNFNLETVIYSKNKIFVMFIKQSIFLWGVGGGGIYHGVSVCAVSPKDPH
jgi:hypothetical protein